MILGYRCANSKMTMAVGADHAIDHRERLHGPSPAPTKTPARWSTGCRPSRASRSSSPRPSSTTPHEASPSRELVDRCRRTLDRVVEVGVEQQFADQRTWLDALLGALRRRDRARSAGAAAGHPLEPVPGWPRRPARAEQSGVPAKGVTGSGYGGHYFWDTEIYVMPFLTYTSPKLARNALRFRYGMLAAAARRAKDLPQSGALFPWRTINGEEASAYYAAGTAQYHIDADIAYALSKYVGATGDEEFLTREGVDILVADRADVGRSRFLAENGARTRLPHPRCDRPRRVHHGGQRQPVHQRDGALQPAGARRLGRVSASATCQRPTRGWSLRLDLVPAEVEEWAACAERDVHPVRRHLGIHPQDSHFLEREVWDLQSPRRRSDRCCCTITRW